MEQPYSLIELFDGREDAWITVKGEQPIEGRLTYKGGYVQHFKWEDRDGRRIKQSAGKEIIDVEGYFQTSDERAAGLFDSEKKPWELELPFFGRVESEWIFLRKTGKEGVYSVRSAP